MRVADGVYRVDGARVGNVYLVAADDGLVLVDTGMPGSARRIVAFIGGLGRSARDVHDIVLTHCDIDHVGSVAELRCLTGARVAIHELDAPVLSGEQPPQKGGRAMRAAYRLLRFCPVAPTRAHVTATRSDHSVWSTSPGTPRAASRWCAAAASSSPATRS